VRYSEKLLQASGISVSTVDLSEILSLAETLAASDPRVQHRVQAICDYVRVEGVPGEALHKMARLAIVLDDWMAANNLQATALQCWSALQQNYGINACTLMSMMSEHLLPSACEVDVTGAATMYALQLASGRPSALVDWNNNYGGEPDKCVLFHCSNWPASFFAPSGGDMAYADILATTLGRERTYGTMAGRVPAGPLTFARISTDDRRGSIHSYVGEGAFTDDPLHTFGGRAVVQVPGLQKLLRMICREGFEHHVAMSAAQCSATLAEAFGTYLGWQVYCHA
jgi:L-fucose isomerase-like protein